MTPVLVRQISCRPSHGLEPVGALTREENLRWPLPVNSLGSLAATSTPPQVIETERIDRVIVSAEGIDDDRLLELISTCGQLGVKVSALPSLAAMIGPAATIDQLEGITMIGINTPTLPARAASSSGPWTWSARRCCWCSPRRSGSAIAIAVKLDSRGPVLFRQERVGRGGKPLPAGQVPLDGASTPRPSARPCWPQSRQAGWLDLEDDPRITRVGRFLRRTSLDELPQLWSVLRGDMSLVGPRPLIP